MYTPHSQSIHRKLVSLFFFKHFTNSIFMCPHYFLSLLSNSPPLPSTSSCWLFTSFVLCHILRPLPLRPLALPIPMVTIYTIHPDLVLFYTHLIVLYIHLMYGHSISQMQPVPTNCFNYLFVLPYITEVKNCSASGFQLNTFK